MKHIIRYARLMLGLVLFGIGSYCNIQANIGLAPWEAFQMGISAVTGIRYGNVVLLLGLVIILIDLALREKIGIGTFLNMLVVGKVVDLLLWLKPLPTIENFWLGLLILLLGQTILCVGSYFYIGAGFGCGPRDAMMVALGKRLKKIPIGAVRGAIEAGALLAGWLMGSKIGLGTVIAVFGISFILQGTFRVLRFDVKAVRHEDFLETLHIKQKAHS